MDQKTLCEIWREICEDIIQKAEEIVHMGVHFRVYDFFFHSKGFRLRMWLWERKWKVIHFGQKQENNV